MCSHHPVLCLSSLFLYKIPCESNLPATTSHHLLCCSSFSRSAIFLSCCPVILLFYCSVIILFYRFCHLPQYPLLSTSPCVQCHSEFLAHITSKNEFIFFVFWQFEGVAFVFACRCCSPKWIRLPPIWNKVASKTKVRVDAWYLRSSTHKIKLLFRNVAFFHFS